MSYLNAVLKKKYVLINKIGCGRFSEVWLGVVFSSKTYYAIKMYDKKNAIMGNREVNYIDQLTNGKYTINFITYVDKFMEDSIYYVVMPLMKCTLREYLDDYVLTFDQMMSILAGVTGTISVFHNELGIIHSDIKSENILMCGISDSVRETVNYVNKIIDACNGNIFNFAKKMSRVNKSENESVYESDNDSEILTDSDIESPCMSDDQWDSDILNELSGPEIKKHSYLNSTDAEMPTATLADYGCCIPINNLHDYGDIVSRYYRAPEIIVRANYTDKIDVWAIGCLMYEMATGKQLFNVQKTNYMSSDMVHINEIHNMFGPFPKLFYNSRKGYVFFPNGECSINKVSFTELLRKNIIVNVTEWQFLRLLYIFQHIFECDPEKRISTTELYFHFF